MLPKMSNNGAIPWNAGTWGCNGTALATKISLNNEFVKRTLSQNQMTQRFSSIRRGPLLNPKGLLSHTRVSCITCLSLLLHLRPKETPLLYRGYHNFMTWALSDRVWHFCFVEAPGTTFPQSLSSKTHCSGFDLSRIIRERICRDQIFHTPCV